MSEPEQQNIAMKILYGEMKFIPPRFWLTRRTDGFYIISEFCSLGPFENESDLRFAARSGGIELSR